MCVECGTALFVSTAPVATQERAFIRTLIAQGKTKAQIKDALVAEYGTGRARHPAAQRLRLERLPRAGRCSSCWPLGGVGFAARRWRRGARRRTTGEPEPGAQQPPLDPEEARRLDAELAAFDESVTGGVDTTVVAAFAVGFVSFVSPCVLPLVPGYLSAVSGVSLAEMQARRATRSRRVLLPALVFCLSFTVVFVALGMTATGLGSTLQDSRGTLDKVAGAVIIALGVFFLLTPFVPRLNREWRPDALIARAGSGGPLVAGAAFAFAWTPCVGPTLGSILTAASIQDTVGQGAVLLLFYSAGLAVPFLRHRRRVHPRDHGVPLAARPLPDRDGGLRARARRRWACCSSPASSPSSTSRPSRRWTRSGWIFGTCEIAQRATSQGVRAGRVWARRMPGRTSRAARALTTCFGGVDAQQRRGCGR